MRLFNIYYIIININQWISKFFYSKFICLTTTENKY